MGETTRLYSISRPPPLAAYIEFLLNEVTRLPAFMRNALYGRDADLPDIPRLRQPIEIARGLDGPQDLSHPAENERDDPNRRAPDKASSEPIPTVRQVY